jgi:hypothetical protein
MFQESKSSLALPAADPTAAEMTLSEREAFDRVLRPEDSYLNGETYWADLPILRRIKFVCQYDWHEAQCEFGSFWKIFKADPLGPLAYYLRNMVLPGAGLGLEGYGFP